MITLKLDYDNIGVYGVMELWSKIRPLLKRMGLKVTIVNAWKSGGGHGIHVELGIDKGTSECVPVDDADAQGFFVIALQAIFGSDRVRELHNLDRHLSEHDDWNRLWDNHVELNPKQLKMLREVWK